MKPIDDSAKDGRTVLIWRQGWDCAMVAKWGNYGTFVYDDDDNDCLIIGWLFDDSLPSYGHEGGYLGWDDDPMPTHYAELPEAI